MPSRHSAKLMGNNETIPISLCGRNLYHYYLCYNRCHGCLVFSICIFFFYFFLLMFCEMLLKCYFGFLSLNRALSHAFTVIITFSLLLWRNNKCSFLKTDLAQTPIAIKCHAIILAKEGKKKAWRRREKYRIITAKISIAVQLLLLKCTVAHVLNFQAGKYQCGQQKSCMFLYIFFSVDTEKQKTKFLLKETTKEVVLKKRHLNNVLNAQSTANNRPVSTLWQPARRIFIC